MGEILRALLHLFLSEETDDKIHRGRGHSDVTSMAVALFLDPSY
jgi:hypothetical protein